MPSPTILLQPRRFASVPGKFVLLPLLPLQEPSKQLPAEVWEEVLRHALAHDDSRSWSWTLLAVCKSFRDTGLPLLYSSVKFTAVTSLERFYDRLHTADQKWDSIRRIPYSTPGRWVHTLDLSELGYSNQFQALLLDSVLTSLFPLVPFLSTLSINPSIPLSRRALCSLFDRPGSVNLRVISGLACFTAHSSGPEEDPFVALLHSCPNLEELHVVGQGLDPMELDLAAFPMSEDSMMVHDRPLNLLKLRVLSLLSMHSSPLMLSLLLSPLPSLHKLTLTPYDDIAYPFSLSTALMTTHGQSLASLLLFTPKSWPTRLHPSPENIFFLAPNLRHLSLENPIPNLDLTEPHNLQILSIPRPKAELWRVLERLFINLPKLSVIRARDVKWVRTGMSSVALGTGVQGEMREWKRRLARRHIRLVDGNWDEDTA